MNGLNQAQDILEKLKASNDQTWDTLKVQAMQEIERLRAIIEQSEPMKEIERLRKEVIRQYWEISDLKYEAMGDNL